MQLAINNLTGSTRTYLSGTISVTGGGTTTVTNTVQLLQLSVDGSLRSDIFVNNASIGDGTNTFGAQDAIAYLYELVQEIGPLSDTSGNGITSTSINSKQRIDINSPSEGVDGVTAPFYTMQVGGKDGSANLQAILTDTAGNQAILLKDVSGNGITSTAINSKQRLDVSLSSEATDGATAPFDTLQVGGKDPNGNLQAFTTVISGEQFVRDVINVSSQYRAQSVTTSAAEAIGAATRLINRKVICITPTNGLIYWGTSVSVTTTTGQPLFANQTLVLSFTDNVPVYLIAATTVDVRILEAS